MPRLRLARPHQRVPLAAGAELDQTLLVEIGERNRLGFPFDDDVVDAGAAAFDQPPRLAVRGRKTGADEQLEGRNAALQLWSRYMQGDRQLRAARGRRSR